MTMVISGDGTITGLSAGGLPDSSVTTAELADAAVTQAKLGTNVAGTGPAFSAYPTSNQTVTTTTYTKVAFQAEQFDTNGNFNNTGSTVGSTPSYAFQPTVAGYYQVTFAVTYIYTAAAGTFGTLYKNGSRYMWSQSSGNANAYPTALGSVLVYMNGSTDYLEVYAYQTTGSTQSLIGTSDYTVFSAFLARAA